MPIAVPVKARGIPASLITENMTPYSIIATALGINVYTLATAGFRVEGSSITLTNKSATIANAVVSHLQVDLNTLSARSPPTGASSKSPIRITDIKLESDGVIPITSVKYGLK